MQNLESRFRIFCSCSRLAMYVILQRSSRVSDVNRGNPCRYRPATTPNGNRHRTSQFQQKCVFLASPQPHFPLLPPSSLTGQYASLGSMAKWKLCTCAHTCGINGVNRPQRAYYHHQETTKKLRKQAQVAEALSLHNDHVLSSPVPTGLRYSQGRSAYDSHDDRSDSDSDRSSSDSDEPSHSSKSRVDSPMNEDGPEMEDSEGNDSQREDFGAHSNSDSVSNAFLPIFMT